MVLAHPFKMIVALAYVALRIGRRVFLVRFQFEADHPGLGVVAPQDVRAGAFVIVRARRGEA